MRKISLDELRSIQIEILDDVHAFAQRMNIRYSICGGTLIGAVRHQGWIPWDDDIDIMMPRQDYELFLSTYTSEANELLALRNTATCIEVFTKVSRKGTIQKDTLLGRAMWGVNIDVFPIDGLGDDAVAQCEAIARQMETLAHICPFYKVVEKNKVLWFIKYVLKRLRYWNFESPLTVKERIETLARKYSLTETKIARGLIEIASADIVFPSQIYQEYTLLPFEGKYYCAIKDYDMLLRTIHGNYMELPPEDKRISHHLYDSYVID